MNQETSQSLAPADQPTNPYQYVTDLILEHLERGTVPWRCPWDRSVGMPCNFHTGSRYQGINLLILGLRRFASPYWLTVHQANLRGGHVKKGERGTRVVKYRQSKSRGEDDDHAKGPARFFLKQYVVFNAVQIRGIEFPKSACNGNIPDQTRSWAQILHAMPAQPQIIVGRTTIAAYDPKSDTVQVPDMDRFESSEAFYLTLFHEVIHSTGHSKRLNRFSENTDTRFGDKDYSKEELVAEMGAAFLAAEAGIARDHHEQSAAYLKGWLDALREPDHRRWIVEASNQGSKAAQFILGEKSPTHLAIA